MGRPKDVDDFINAVVTEMGLEGYSVIDPNDAAERILRKCDKVQKSETHVRGWAFHHVRKALYDRFHLKRAVDNPRLAKQLTFAGVKDADWLPEYIPVERDGKPLMIMLDYTLVTLDEVEIVIEERRTELETKRRTFAALISWLDMGVRTKQLKNRRIA
jgi:hypothetical protein